MRSKEEPMITATSPTRFLPLEIEQEWVDNHASCLNCPMKKNALYNDFGLSDYDACSDRRI